MTNNSSIRVLQILGSLNMGGKEIFAMNAYRHINRESIQFDFAIFSKGKDIFEDEVLNLGGEIYHCKNIKSKNKFLGLLFDMFALKKVLKKHKYKIIHCHGCSFIGILSASIPAKICKIPVIIAHAHNPGIPKNNIVDKISRYFLKKLITWSCSDYYACSDTAAESKYEKKLIDSNRIQYIHNAIEIDRFKFNAMTRKKLRNKYNLLDNEKVIGVVGRLEKQKNHNFLIDIFKEFHKLQPYSKLFIIGDGSLRKQLEEKVSDLKLDKNVVFTGMVNNPVDYYQLIDLIVMPSYYEGLPFALIEAQTSGLPCVVSTNITKEVKILETTTYVSLDKNALEWAQIINEQSTNSKREIAYEILDEKGYNINSEVKVLEDNYKTLFSK